MEALQANPTDLVGYSDEALLALTRDLLTLQEKDRQENQLRYYQPVNDTAKGLHTSLEKTIGVGGGNGSSKTDSCLVEMVIRATGQVPVSLRDCYPPAHLRGPITCRVVCESLTTTLVPIILPKLQWWKWSGVSEQGGPKGHWGWIPRYCLINGDWSKSWDERRRLLRLYYRDPAHPEQIKGESLIQFMSYDQDPTDFASGDFHLVLHDEPPKHAIWKENRARVMRVDGTMLLAMTWPDDPAIAVDWIFDEVYEKAQAGADHDAGIKWINLRTTDNPHLNQTAVAERAKQMSKLERETRIEGQPIRLSNRVHPLFTDMTRDWCFRCHDAAILDDKRQCGQCGSLDVVVFCHTQPVVANDGYPVLYALDPHPRKPHMMLWVQVNPNDDLQQVHEAQVDGSPEDVWAKVQQVEADYRWRSVRRLIDPNMGRSPSDTHRELTWQDAFERVGLVCDLADDSDVGRTMFNDYLKPDERLRTPRYVVDPRCTTTIHQLKRYLWDSYRQSADRDLKQVPKDRHSDMPTLLKYILNSGPTFRELRSLGQVYHHQGQRSAVGY